MPFHTLTYVIYGMARVIFTCNVYPSDFWQEKNMIKIQSKASSWVPRILFSKENANVQFEPRKMVQEKLLSGSWRRGETQLSYVSKTNGTPLSPNTMSETKTQITKGEADQRKVRLDSCHWHKRLGRGDQLLRCLGFNTRVPEYQWARLGAF